MVKDCLEVVITALGKTTKNISIGFIRQGANFIQINHNGMQLLWDYRDIISLETSQTFALKNLEKILECIDDAASHEKILSKLTW